MTTNAQFEIKRFSFDNSATESLRDLIYSKEQWPVVYLLSDETLGEAYVGETTDISTRIGTHLKTEKQRLSVFHLMGSALFNKSATLDIESNLIKYISGDGKFKLMNANVGLANHTYYQKQEVYWDIFHSIWDKLRSDGLVKHSLTHISNSDLFKYSPYKSLSAEQSKSLLIILKSLLSDKIKLTVAEGGAGTGKSILAIFLFKLLNSDPSTFNYKEFGDEETEFIETVKRVKLKYPKPRMALVIPMASFRETIRKVFKNVKGLDPSMVIAPAEVTRSQFDIIVVDEAHRLRRRVNLGSYFKAFDEAAARLGFDKLVTNELEWVLHQSEKTLLFYDENQSIKPSDITAADFKKWSTADIASRFQLKSQLRVKGGVDYVKYIADLLDGKQPQLQKRSAISNYEFRVFDSIEELIREIKGRNDKAGLSRLIAGYSWEWKSKNDPAAYDIRIEDVQLRWNAVSKDWINSRQAIEEVGCIHTTQGYDLNYAGVIFGNEISYDFEKQEIVIKAENYFDRNGKASIRNPAELKSYIINIYKTILLRGIHGTFVYACDPSLRQYLLQAAIAEEEEGAALESIETHSLPTVPLYNFQAAAGAFSDLQSAEIIDNIPLPPHIRYSADLFCCRVTGESMNKVIPNNSICLFRRDGGGSRNGKIVLVQHASIQDRDWGHGFTVKEYRSSKWIDDQQWKHQSISLYPLSDDSSYPVIELQENEMDELRVVGIFERVLR